MYHPAVQLTMWTIETENLFSYFNITVMRQNSWTYVIWTKNFRVFILALHSLSPLEMDTLPPPLSKSGLKLVCNVNIVKGHLKSENSQDYDQKPQRNCPFIKSASFLIGKRLPVVDFLRNTAR